MPVHLEDGVGLADCVTNIRDGRDGYGIGREVRD